MNSRLIPITPQSKPRMTARDRWGTNKRPVVAKYHQYVNELRALGVVSLPSELKVTFYIPMPPSWSNKRKAEMNGKPHQQRPDVDNLSKALMDAVCDDDSYIYDLHAIKRWAYTGSIELLDDNIVKEQKNGDI